MKYRSHFHCVYDLQYHLVLVTKYRKKCLKKEIRTRLEEICKKTCKFWDIDLLEFGGEKDHIHLLLSMHPNVWTRAYCILTTGGATIDVIKKYIEKQGRNSSPT